jgi:three-Cys-motif partner protein
MTDKEKPDCSQNHPLFPDLPTGILTKARKYKRVQQSIWTENKAKFIQQYLRFFVQITHHGTYIDGFAGPQYHQQLNAWAAALVLESEPKWLRHIFLCELTKTGVRALNKLVSKQPERDRRGKKIYRKIEVLPGDFNITVNEILTERKIAQKEATFCLLDQRTFECHWATVAKLAAFKKPPHHKVELLYFLGVGWLHRAFSGIRNIEKMKNWWGNDQWRELKAKTEWDIADIVRKRFDKELGYTYTAAYPIFDKKGSNRIMYYMIHASDHDEAPALMVRAHHKAVRSLPKEVQKRLFPK